MDAPKTIPAPGIYYDVPAEAYFAWDAINASFLKKMNDCARQARWEADHPKDPTPAMLKGSATHTLILEPDKEKGRYLISGPCSATVKSTGGLCEKPGKVLCGGHWLCGVHGRGRTPDPSPMMLDEDGGVVTPAIITQDDYNDALAMAISARDDKYARSLLERSRKEVSIVWIDPVTGVKCKARLDLYNDDPTDPEIGDVKTTTDSSPEGFQKAIADFDYPIQVAMYLDAATSLDGVLHDKFYFIAIKNQPAYTTACYKAHQEVIHLGRARYRSLLEDVKWCQQNGYWPGYHDHQCEPIGVPHYYFQKEAYK